MMVPPLSERPVTDEDEEQFRAESAPRKYTLRQRWANHRAEVKARRPKSVRARARAWLHVEPFYWGMRVVYVALATGAVFAVYINGVAEGACQFFCVWGLEVGGDSVGVGGGELGEGLFPVGGGVSLDEACVSCSFVGGFASVCEALGGSFVFDVADG